MSNGGIFWLVICIFFALFWITVGWFIVPLFNILFFFCSLLMTIPSFLTKKENNYYRSY